VRLNIGGETADAAADGHGYLVVRRQWRPGDVLTLELDVTARLSYPSRRVDALRGTVALERGPLVYCFEQADQADGVSIEDLAIDPGQLPGQQEQYSLPGLDTTLAVRLPAARLASAAPSGSSADAPGSAAEPGLPYAAQPDPTAISQARPTAAVAVPYFQWDNRDGGPMRVWMPLYVGAVAQRDEHDPGQEPSPRRTS
jgi:uncharacterized protein